MEQIPITSPSETFIHELRYALNHLYDPAYLRESSLASILGVSGRFDTPTALQDLLTRAIDAMKPGQGAVNKNHAQAIYDLLLYRYVQQFNQDEIANQLGISVRHLRRQQNLAIYELACKLWEQFELEKPGQSGDFRSHASAGQPTHTVQLAGELEWLKNTSAHVATDISTALAEVSGLIQPLADQHACQIIIPASPSGLVLVHPVAFQQILLSLLSIAVRFTPGKTLQLTLSDRPGWQYLNIETGSPSQTRVDDQTDQPWLESVKQMIELSEGNLECQFQAGWFRARVAFHSVDQLNVLVIDDNPDIVTMLQRFVAETRYRVVGLSDPKSAVDYALQIHPDLIVLDIMMPQVDGLQVLSRFKHHPMLGKLPVIICSVLPQKDLAASLGASDFIQKPIQRESFIAALNRSSQNELR